MPMDPLSFSPPDRPTTLTVISLLGPPMAAESPLLRVSPPETWTMLLHHPKYLAIKFIYVMLTKFPIYIYTNDTKLNQVVFYGKQGRVEINRYM